MSLLQKSGLVTRATQLSRRFSQEFGCLLYRCNGRLPFTRRKGYAAYRNSQIERLLKDEEFLKLLQGAGVLPNGLGVKLDERVIEYPWVMSRLLQYGEQCKFLDAGSTMNHAFIMEHPLVKRHKWTLLTLAPERECFAHLGVSYVYDDLRGMPFKENCFDAVFCVSVIEHVGMDNSAYTADKSYRENKPRDFVCAIDEMKRVLNPDGWLYLTVPFGRHEHHGWFQQFDSAMLSDMISRFRPRKDERVFYRSTPEGWRQCPEDDCRSLSYWVAPKDKSSRNGESERPPPPVSATGLACIALQK